MRLSAWLRALIYALVLFGSLLSACGGGGSSAAPPPLGPTPTPLPGPPGVESVASANAALASGGGCALRALFVHQGGGVRGYPLDATGETAPCAAFPASGSAWGPMTVSRFGYIHVATFQSTGGYPVFAPNANGNATPVRNVGVGRDRWLLATDNQLSDYIVDDIAWLDTNCWDVALSDAAAVSQHNCTVNTAPIHALATEPDNRLIIVSADRATNTPRVEIYAGAASAAPALVQTIAGSATTLLAGAAEIAVATDPSTGEIYVYTAGPSVATQVAVFASNASGNVAPERVLTVPKATEEDPFDPSLSSENNLLAVDDRGQLYVGYPNTAVARVYARGASGNAAPIRTITNASAVVTFPDGSPDNTPVAIGVRTTIR